MLFSTAVNSELVTKPLILVIIFKQRLYLLHCLSQQERFLICLHLFYLVSKLVKSDFKINLDVSVPIAFFKSDFVA